MAEVRCSVASCSYNKEGGCYAHEIKVAGTGAAQEDMTCCGSFLSQQHYSNIAGNSSDRKRNDKVACSATNCKYNSNYVCSKDEIQIGGSKDATIYTETECQSFAK